MKLLLFSLLSLGLATLAASQPSPTPPADRPPTLLDVLTPTFAPVNAAARILFTADVFRFQTPLVIRYVTFFALALYEPIAACHPSALSFFGVRDQIGPNFCSPLPQIKIFHYIFHRLVAQEFPDQAPSIAAFLRENGLTPDSLSTDTSTEIGWANHVAERAAKYFRSDGWNSLGDRNRHDFRQPYADFTGYTPANLAQQPVSALVKPLRWQPLVQPVGRTGEFRAQVHVIPHVGEAKPLALTKDDLDDRVSESPYNNPNGRDSLGKADRELMESLIRKYFRTSRLLTVQQRFEAALWENKLLSLGGFIPFYRTIFDEITDFENAWWFMGEMIAQYDAVIVAWREKRRNDLVRPTTIIRRLWEGRIVSAFVNTDVGVKRVRAEEFEPLLPTQPHSEYPSASATICTASLENLRAAFNDKFGDNFTEPAFVLPVIPGVFRILPDEGVRFDLVYETLEEAAKGCGLSRLYGGVHFGPSVREGLRLGRGIGRKAYLQMASLVSGAVPENCDRCLHVDD